MSNYKKYTPGEIIEDALVFVVVIAVIAGIWFGFKVMAGDIKPVESEPSACSPQPVYVLQGENPGEAIERAVIELRDVHGLLPAGKGNIDLDNVGNAERILLAHRGNESGIVQPATQVSVCSTRLHIESVNGVHVD